MNKCFSFGLSLILMACQGKKTSPQAVGQNNQDSALVQERTEIQAPSPAQPSPPPNKDNETSPPKPQYELKQLYGDWRNLKPQDDFDEILRFKRNGKCGFAPFDEIQTFEIQGDELIFTYIEDREAKAKAKILELDGKNLYLDYGKTGGKIRFKKV